MKSPKVLISILNWNAPINTVKTVQSVLLSDYKDYSIILLDNNSTDNSETILKDSFRDLSFIKMKSNLGYAGAHKVAAKIAIKENYDLLWILNNDVEVYTSSLSELVNAYERNGDGLFGSVSIKSDGATIDFAGGLEIGNNNLIDGNSGYNILGGKRIDEVEILERQVSGLQGSSFLMPVNIILKYGFMDTRFFLYGEETDYCYRLRKKYNIPSFIVPTSRVIHIGGGSFVKNKKLQWIRIYYLTRNGNLVHNKYQKDIETAGMGIKKLPHYFRYFFRHFFLTSTMQKNFDYWNNYYEELGNLHSFLRIKGKCLDPEKLLDSN